MKKERVLLQAEFNDAVTTYWLVNGIIVFAVTVFGIVLIPLWYLVGKFFTRKYLDSHQCVLTNRNLKVSKGILTQVEKTVPLDRITDLGIVQGPLMRWFDIEAMSVETAGQSGVGSLIRLTGIKDGRAFRDAVLDQRDKVVGSDEEKATTGTANSATASLSTDGSTHKLLTEIRDSLVRLESKFDTP